MSLRCPRRQTPPPTLPRLVRRALAAARRHGFAHACRPEQGRLLHALAGGWERIGETGTGCGVGLGVAGVRGAGGRTAGQCGA